MRHRGVLIIKDDKIAFLYKKGNVMEIEFKNIEKIEMYGKNMGILFYTKDNLYIFTCKGEAGSYALGGNIGTMISKASQNKEVYNTLNYLFRDI